MILGIRKIKIRPFTQEIEGELLHHQTVLAQMKLEVAGLRETPNGDETVDVTYELKPLFADVRVLDDKGEVTTHSQNLVKETSRSQKLRQRCFRISQETGKSEESLYNLAMDKANEYLDQADYEPLPDYDTTFDGWRER